MTTSRNIQRTFQGVPTMEGAGVRLKRVFGHREAPLFDPFLLFDDFSADRPQDFIKGFPWHPHRGIETITYVLTGDVEHGDSLGNQGVISSGDVQWMTAGSGIIHQEMPKGDSQGRMAGFQLWANLPASEKMMPPRYRDIKAGDIPEIQRDNGVVIRIICGTMDGVQGPAGDIVTDPAYMDITIPTDTTHVQEVQKGHTAFSYIIQGQGRFDTASEKNIKKGELVLFADGDQIRVTASNEPLRFLLASGRPLKETVAWRGPIVMNTEEELKIAFEEYKNGTFIKHG